MTPPDIAAVAGKLSEAGLVVEIEPTAQNDIIVRTVKGTRLRFSIAAMGQKAWISPDCAPNNSPFSTS